MANTIYIQVENGVLSYRQSPLTGTAITDDIQDLISDVDNAMYVAELEASNGSVSYSCESLKSALASASDKSGDASDYLNYVITDWIAVDEYNREVEDDGLDCDSSMGE